MINLVVVEQTLNHKLELIESSASSPLSTKQNKILYICCISKLNLQEQDSYFPSSLPLLASLFLGAGAEPADNDVVFLAEPESWETIKVGMF